MSYLNLVAFLVRIIHFSFEMLYWVPSCQLKIILFIIISITYCLIFRVSIRYYLMQSHKTFLYLYLHNIKIFVAYKNFHSKWFIISTWQCLKGLFWDLNCFYTWLMTGLSASIMTQSCFRHMIRFVNTIRGYRDAVFSKIQIFWPAAINKISSW